MKDTYLSPWLEDQLAKLSTLKTTTSLEAVIAILGLGQEKGEKAIQALTELSLLQWVGECLLVPKPK